MLQHTYPTINSFLLYEPSFVLFFSSLFFFFVLLRRKLLKIPFLPIKCANPYHNLYLEGKLEYRKIIHRFSLIPYSGGGNP